MTDTKYFGDHITADMKVALKWLNEKLKKKNPNYQFNKPSSDVAIKWEYSDWCDHIDSLWSKADNGTIKAKEL